MKRLMILGVWILILCVLLYIYYLHPEIFQHLFEYEGPGSPYINTPSE